MMKRSIAACALLASGATATYAADNAGTPDDWPPPMHGPMRYGMLLADRFETAFADGHESYAWDVDGWYGGDWNRLRVKTEGEGEWGSSPGDAELQLLFSRLFAPYWEWQVGVRHDSEPGDGRSFAVAGIQGVAPYEFEIDAAVFLSEDGDWSARVEAEYELKLTQRAVLQPRFELDAAFSDVPGTAIASGIHSSEVGLRLRYELRREFAPYVGLEWQRAWGTSADRVRAAGEDPDMTSVVAGIRFWF